MRKIALILMVLVSLIIANVQAEEPKTMKDFMGIETLATQAGDVYAAMFRNTPNKDAFIKDALMNVSVMYGCKTADEIRQFIKMGLDEAHKQIAVLNQVE